MWVKELVECARAYPTGVLTTIDPGGYPASVRCQVEFDEAGELVAFPSLSAQAIGGQGKACLLFHRHKADFSGQHELMIRGELTAGDGGITLRPEAFLTGSGSLTSDRMPVSGTMTERFRFMLVGRRKAREYLAKRGQPWTPRPWKKMLRYLDEGPASLDKP